VPSPKKIIVGRKNDLIEINKFMKGKSKKNFIYNLYGPGGIGKTELRNLLENDLQESNSNYALINGDTPNFDFSSVLRIIRAKVFYSNFNSKKLNIFDAKIKFYFIVSNLVGKFGINYFTNEKKEISNIVNINDSTLINNLNEVFENFYSYDNYMNTSISSITELLSNALNEFCDELNIQPIIIFDAYEKLSSLDFWLRTEMVKNFPEKSKFIFFGRDSLPDISYGWNDYGNNTVTKYLDEIDEPFVHSFFEKNGLHDNEQYKNIFLFTGGYPLCMQLTVSLVRKMGGWQELEGFSRLNDRYEVSKYLLERLLEQERTKPVKDFIENGVVFPFFNIEVISKFLNLSMTEAEKIYNTLSTLSFIEKSSAGLKFHDKVQEILIERLRFMNIFEEKREKALQCLNLIRNENTKNDLY